MVLKKQSKSSAPRKKKSSSRAKAKSAPMKSFRVAKETVPFTTVKFTRQTFYWIVLTVIIVLSQLWILQLQMNIADLTNALQLLQADL